MGIKGSDACDVLPRRPTRYVGSQLIQFLQVRFFTCKQGDVTAVASAQQGCSGAKRLFYELLNKCKVLL